MLFDMTRTAQLETNRELLLSCKRLALSSVYWSKRGYVYHVYEVEHFGPMINDSLFLSLFNRSDTVGANEMESKLGRRLTVEELQVCPLSANYLIFGEPTITGTDIEQSKLRRFYDTIEEAIYKNEKQTTVNEIKRLNRTLNNA